MAISKEETINLRAQLKLAKRALLAISVGDPHDPSTFAERTLEEIQELELKSKGFARVFGE